MQQLNKDLIGDRKTSELLLKRNYAWKWSNAIDSSKRPKVERSSFYIVIFLQILLVIPFPALVLYFSPKPKYIIPLFIAGAIAQTFPAGLLPKNRSIVFFCMCGILLMLFEATMYGFFIYV